MTSDQPNDSYESLKAAYLAEPQQYLSRIAETWPAPYDEDGQFTLEFLERLKAATAATPFIDHRPTHLQRLLSPLRAAWEWEKNYLRNGRQEWNDLQEVIEYARFVWPDWYAANFRDDRGAYYRMEARNAILNSRPLGDMNAVREARRVGTRWWVNDDPPSNG